MNKYTQFFKKYGTNLLEPFNVYVYKEEIKDLENECQGWFDKKYETQELCDKQQEQISVLHKTLIKYKTTTIFLLLSLIITNVMWLVYYSK